MYKVLDSFIHKGLKWDYKASSFLFIAYTVKKNAGFANQKTIVYFTETTCSYYVFTVILTCDSQIRKKIQVISVKETVFY